MSMITKQNPKREHNKAKNKGNQPSKEDICCSELQESIQRGDVFYTITQTEDESREVYLARISYIIDVLTNNTSIDINDVIIDKSIGASYIWRNIKYYGMSYPNTLLRTLNMNSLK